MAETAESLGIFDNSPPDDILVRDSRTKDETGRRYGKLVVTGFAGSDTSKGNVGGALWHCLCACGGRKTVRGGQLRQGKVVTCGECSKGISYLAERIATGEKPPCERGCSMRMTCYEESLGCKPYVRWLSSGGKVMPDPEKYPPSAELYE